MSLPERSTLLPTETNCDSPIPSRPAASIVAIPSPPDCDMKPTDPARAWCGANVALSRTPGAVLRTPRQFGPTIRIPAARQTSTSSCWRAAPSDPASAKPEEITTSARAPTAAHSRAIAATCSAGTMITARSTSPGTSPIVR
jgi:hypothetical protein